MRFSDDGKYAVTIPNLWSPAAGIDFREFVESSGLIKILGEARSRRDEYTKHPEQGKPANRSADIRSR